MEKLILENWKLKNEKWLQLLFNLCTILKLINFLDIHSLSLNDALLNLIFSKERIFNSNQLLSLKQFFVKKLVYKDYKLVIFKKKLFQKKCCHFESLTTEINWDTLKLIRLIINNY